MYLIYNIIIDFILYLCSFSSSVSVYTFCCFSSNCYFTEVVGCLLNNDYDFCANQVIETVNISY